MDASARRVRAERDRRRLPEKGPWSRWTRRIAGLLATAVFLGVGFASAQMILPDTGEDSGAAITAAPAATPAKKAKHKKSDKKKASKPKGLTKAQKAARADAVKEVRSQGFTTLHAADYDPKATLRVLIGRPVGDAAGGYQAFFFLKDAYLGKDALTPSTYLRVSKKGTTKTTVALTYGVYAPGDPTGEPSGRKRVRFRLEGQAIHALDTIPLQAARLQRASG
jgi:hypothetical protein